MNKASAQRCDNEDDAQITEMTPPFTLLTTLEAAQSALPELLAQPVLGLDIETAGMGLDPHRGRIRLLQLATPRVAYLLDTFQVDPTVWQPVLDSESVKIIHNAKFDLQFLLARGLAVNNVFDTLLADQVLRGSRIPRSLKDLSKDLLHCELDKHWQKESWEGALAHAQLEYAARDASTLLPLHAKLLAMAHPAKLERCCRLENRAVPAVAWLEYSGAPFDTAAWRQLAEKALTEKQRLADEMNEMAGRALGSNTLFGRQDNWESPAQVSKVLQRLGLRIQDTNETTLVNVATQHPIIDKLLQYREISKRVGTYGLNVLHDVHPKTGRIHADWRQIGADSGRMSCQKPNLQNVPRTPAYRACFRAPEGRMLVKCDFSQIELRITAEMAHEARMLSAYQQGEDLHVLTAKAILGKQEISKDDRQIAKSANYGLLYGMGAEGFRQYAKTNYGVALSAEKASLLRNAFFDAYPGLREWHWRQPEGKIDTRTVCGRRRLGVEKFTEKLNSPVQGTSADGLKAALALLWETRDRCPDAFPVLAVHDEIVVECDEDKTEPTKEWLVNTMEWAMQCFLQKVPVVAEATVGKDWSGK